VDAKVVPIYSDIRRGVANPYRREAMAVKGPFLEVD
jgi:hypothetical protein